MPKYRVVDNKSGYKYDIESPTELTDEQITGYFQEHLASQTPTVEEPEMGIVHQEKAIKGASSLSRQLQAGVAMHEKNMESYVRSRLEQGASTKEIEAEFGGLEDPFVNPLEDIPALLTGATVLHKGGKLSRLIFKEAVKHIGKKELIGKVALTTATGTATGIPIGQVAEEIRGSDKYRAAALPFMIVTGLLSGMALEAPLERRIIDLFAKTRKIKLMPSTSISLEEFKATISKSSASPKQQDDLATAFSNLVTKRQAQVAEAPSGTYARESAESIANDFSKLQSRAGYDELITKLKAEEATPPSRSLDIKESERPLAKTPEASIIDATSEVTSTAHIEFSPSKVAFAKSNEILAKPAFQRTADDILFLKAYRKGELKDSATMLSILNNQSGSLDLTKMKDSVDFWKLKLQQASGRLRKGMSEALTKEITTLDGLVASAKENPAILDSSDFINQSKASFSKLENGLDLLRVSPPFKKIERATSIEQEVNRASQLAGFRRLEDPQAALKGTIDHYGINGTIEVAAHIRLAEKTSGPERLNHLREADKVANEVKSSLENLGRTINGEMADGLIVNHLQELDRVKWKAENLKSLKPSQEQAISKPTIKSLKVMESDWLSPDPLDKALGRNSLLNERGSIEIPLFKDTTTGSVYHAAKTAYNVMRDTFEFYRHLPLELRDAYRVDLIGGIHKLYTYKKNLQTHLWGKLSKKQVQSALDIIFAQARVGRVKKGLNDNITLAEAEANLIEAMKVDDTGVFAAVDRWHRLAQETFDDLVRRGKLKPDSGLEDYAPHYVDDYFNDYLFALGVPTKARLSHGGYLKKAKGLGDKTIRKDADLLVNHLTKIRHQNMLDDWILSNANRWDIVPDMKAKGDIDGLAKLFGDEAVLKWIQSGGKKKLELPDGTIRDLNGIRYHAFSPDAPFNAKMAMKDGAWTQIGRKRTYLLEENTWKFFQEMNSKTGKFLNLMNSATASWKSAAIITHFLGYNAGNIVGDSFLWLMFHPEPLKAVRHLSKSFKFMTTPLAKRTQYQMDLGRYLTDNDIIGSGFIYEVKHFQSGNYGKALLNKLWKASEHRENFLRIAQGAYLFDELKAGRAAKIRKDYNWIDTVGLSDERALATIARTSMIDYSAVTQTYRKYVRGFALPFGTFFLHGTALTFKYAKHHPIKFVGGMMALPFASLLWNNRNEESRAAYAALPEEVKGNLVWVGGKTATGTTRVLSLITPQDAFFGTKIFSIATNQANDVLNGNKSFDQAFKDTFKMWKGREWRGAVSLGHPIARFVWGAVFGKDYFDKAPVYSQYGKHDPWDLSLFAAKCFYPWAAGYITQTEAKNKPSDLAVKRVMEDTFGLRAFGIREYNDKLQEVIDGKAYDWDDVKDADKLLEREGALIERIKDDWVKSGQTPQQYMQSETYLSHIERLKKLNAESSLKSANAKILLRRLGIFNGRVPTNEELIKAMEQDPHRFSQWLDNKIDMASTDEEKRKWNERKQKARTWQLHQKLEQSIKQGTLEPKGE